MPPDTGVDSTGFLDLTDVDNSKPAQNRRLLKSLQLLNLNMSFWRRKANFNANSNYQEDEVEKGLGCCKIVIGVCVFVILMSFTAMGIVMMLKVDGVAERLGEKCQMTNCETGNLNGRLGTTPPPAAVTAKDESTSKPIKGERQNDVGRRGRKNDRVGLDAMTDQQKLYQLLRQMTLKNREKERESRRL